MGNLMEGKGCTNLLPPLAKGRTVRGTVRYNPGAATINHGGPPKAVEGWLRCRERYRYDKRQDVLLLIRNNTPSLYVSTPQSASLTAPLGKGGREVVRRSSDSTTLPRGRASCLPFIRGGGPPKAVEGWKRRREHDCGDRAIRCVATPQSRLRRARRINVRYRALDLTEVSPGHFDPLGKGGREVRATPRA